MTIRPSPFATHSDTIQEWLIPGHTSQASFWPAMAYNRRSPWVLSHLHTLPPWFLQWGNHSTCQAILFILIQHSDQGLPPVDPSCYYGCVLPGPCPCLQSFHPWELPWMFFSLRAAFPGSLGRVPHSLSLKLPSAGKAPVSHKNINSRNILRQMTDTLRRLPRLLSNLHSQEREENMK